MHGSSAAVLCCALGGALVATTTSSSSWWWKNDGGVLLVRAESSTLSMRGPTRRRVAAQKLLHGARRLEDNNSNNDNNNYNGYYEPDEENTFLQNYSIHVLSCLDGERVRNTGNENNNDDENNNQDASSYDESAVLFRLCPTNTCDDTNGSTTNNLGCEDGYGDYVIGMHTFLALYWDSVQDQQNNDDDYYNPMMAYNRYGASFDASEYLECGAYDPEAALEQAQENGYYQYSGGYNNNNNNQNQQGYSMYGDTQFYIGPGCTADGTTIGLQLYRNEDCTAAAGEDTVDFALLSSGVWEDGLPFTEGGVIDLRCTRCARSQQQNDDDDNDDDDDDDSSDLCRNAYAQAATRCEEKTDFSTNQNYYGYAYGNNNNNNNYNNNNGQDDDENTNYYYSQNNNGCEYIETLLRTVYPSSVSTIVSEAVSFVKEVASRSITTDPIVLAVTVLVALMAIVGTVVLYRAFVTTNPRVSEKTEEKDVHNYVAATDNNDGALSAKQKIEEAEFIMKSVNRSEQDEEKTPIHQKTGWFS